MKNKKVQGLTVNQIVLIILGVIILGVSIIMITAGWDALNKNKITITEEVCKEEVDYSEIGKAWDNFYDSLRNIEDDWRKYACLHYSDFSIKNMSEICNELSKLAKAKIDDMSMLSFWFEQNKPTATICEQVEVDKIFIVKESIWKASSNCIFNEKSNEFGFGTGGDWEGTKEEVIQEQKEFDKRWYDKCKKEFGTYPYEKIITNETKISKQHLTLEWLNENTECVSFEDDKGNFISSNSIFVKEMCLNFSSLYCNLECSKYKIGNYTITVKR